MYASTTIEHSLSHRSLIFRIITGKVSFLCDLSFSRVASAVLSFQRIPFRLIVFLYSMIVDARRGWEVFSL